MKTQLNGPYVPLHALCGGDFFTLTTEASEIICKIQRHPSESIEETKARAEYVQQALATWERALTLATKHCPNDHPDWQEILKLACREG